MRILPVLLCASICLGVAPLPSCADRQAAAQPFDLKAARERDARIFRELEWKITGKRPPAKPKTPKPVPDKTIVPEKPAAASPNAKTSASAQADRREQARRQAEIERFQEEQRAIAQQGRPVLSILDRAVASGKVPKDAVAEARELVLSGRNDTRSLKVVEATAWYCLAMLAPSEHQRDLRLRHARVAQAAVAEMDAARQRTILR